MITLKELAEGAHIAEGYVNIQAVAEGIQTVAKHVIGLLPPAELAEVHAAAVSIEGAAPIVEGLTANPEAKAVEGDVATVAGVVAADSQAAQ